MESTSMDFSAISDQTDAKDDDLAVDDLVLAKVRNAGVSNADSIMSKSHALSGTNKLYVQVREVSTGIESMDLLTPAPAP